jgi:hypothetical protein
MSESHSPAPVKVQIPGKLQRQGQMLMNLQCWLWGQDVKRAEGNLLVAYGFERMRPPEGFSGSTQYTLVLPNDLHLRLWGFGMYIGRGEGIYINRFDFIPRIARLSDAWQGAETMSQLRRSYEAGLVIQATRWIAAYESWVASEFGLLYRQRTLTGWDKTAIRPNEIAEAWRTLACDLEVFERRQRR